VNTSAPRRLPPSTAIVAYAAAGLLATASAVANVSSAVGKHPDIAGKIVSGSIALAVALLVAVTLPAALSALRSRQYVGAVLCSIAFLLAGAYSISAALGVIGKPRLEAGIHASDDASARQRLADERQRITGELATLAPARPAAELTGLIASKIGTPGANACQRIDGPTSARICSEVASLQEEAARSNRIGALSGTLARIDGDTARLGRQTIHNADAAALAHVLASVGLSVDAGAVNTALLILAVVVLECGSGLAFAVAGILAASSRDVPSLASPEHVKPAQPSTARPLIACEQDAAIGPSTEPEKSSSPERLQGASTTAGQTTRDKVLALIRDAGGSVTAGQRAIAKQVGASPARLNVVVKALAAEGHIRVVAGSTATTLAIVQ
jgi:hypothetical protein